MERTLIKEVLQNGNAGDPVTVCGWVRSRRESKGFAFVVLNDGSSQDSLQLVVPGESAAFGEIVRCNTGAAIMAKGVLKDSPGKGQRLELETSEITVFGDSDPEKYPLQKKGHTLEFLREIGHLRPRTNTFGAVFRLRNLLAAAVHDFFQSRGFVWVHTPIITSSDCEGAGELFSVTSLDIGNPPKQGNRRCRFYAGLFRQKGIFDCERPA